MKKQNLKIAIFATLFLSMKLMAAENDPDVPFANRIVFSETPELGKKWHGGVRMKDILCWDMYMSIADWFSIDLLRYGVPLSIPDQESGDTIHLTDEFNLFTVKSRPLKFNLFNHPYKIGMGIEAYSTVFKFSSSADGSSTFDMGYSQGGLFVVQSWFLENREWWIFHGSHYLNLVSSFASHKIGNNKNLTSWYFIPGYRYFFDCPSKLSFDVEFYYMNPYEIPVKLLQIAIDPDKMPFENPDLHFASFMFWGVSYSWKHLRLEAHIGNHPSFAGLIIPVVGAGWNF